MNPEVMDELQGEVDQRAEEIDYSQAAGKELLAEHLDALRQLKSLQTDFEFLSQLDHHPELLERRETKALQLDVGIRLWDLWVYFASVAQASAHEIFKRLGKNGTNRNFALLKIAHDLSDVGIQLDAYRELRKIGLSIPWKNGWRHPDGTEEWNSLLNLVLSRELEQYKVLGPEAAFAEMLNNRFAYVYRAMECRFLDELRRLYRHPDRLSDHKAVVDDIPERVVNPFLVEKGLRERAFTIKFIESVSNETILPGVGVILHEAALKLKDEDDSWLEQPDRRIRADIVKAVAETMKVSEQQARKYIRDMGVNEDDMRLRDIRERLRELEISR
jgi:hypothetical protein